MYSLYFCCNKVFKVHFYIQTHDHTEVSHSTFYAAYNRRHNCKFTTKEPTHITFFNMTPMARLSPPFYDETFIGYWAISVKIAFSPGFRGTGLSFNNYEPYKQAVESH